VATPLARELSRGKRRLPDHAMPDAAASVGVLFAAIFVVPRLMAFIPDFDPLMVIVGLFVLLAGVQQLGFQMNGEGDDRPRNRDSDRNSSSSRDWGSGQAKEAGPEDILQQAERCLEQNGWHRAEELARQVTDIDPENSRAWEILATAQKWDGKREEAVATIKRAREVFEVDSAGLKQLAAEMESSAASPGEEAEKCAARGEEFFSQRQFDLAIECYTKALDSLGDLDSDSALREVQLRSLRRRAACAQQLQDWGTCRRDATAVLEADPSDAQALLQRAAANEALEKFSAALEDARRLLAIDPRSAAANRIVHSCQLALRS